MNRKNVIFINSHPIQYFAPLYKYMNECGISTEVWYDSDESVKGGYDKQFGTEVKWDIPLLNGYKYTFFKNYSWKPSHFNGFFGLINPGMFLTLFRIPKSVIIVHGFHYFTHFIILLLGKICGHTICLRCELPLHQEHNKKGLKQIIRKITFQYLLFPRVHYFLYIGKQNNLFYQAYGVKESQLLFCPYSVDNSRFAKQAKTVGLADLLKQQLKIPATDKVFLCVAKYISKKRPLDLIKAFHNLAMPNTWLVLVGEGELRSEMESYIKTNGLTNVILTGFINQSDIGTYYALSDVFVMSSGEGETWGLSVNEAMNFKPALVISDMTGCAADLVVEGKNGYCFNTKNITALYEKMYAALQLNETEVKQTSESLLAIYSYDTIVSNLRLLV